MDGYDGGTGQVFAGGVVDTAGHTTIGDLCLQAHSRKQEYQQVR